MEMKIIKENSLSPADEPDGIKNADEKDSFIVSDKNNHKSHSNSKLNAQTNVWETKDFEDDEHESQQLNNKQSLFLDGEPPKDRYNIVLFIFVLHGIGTLTPWNMFITAEKYFTEYKLSPGNISLIHNNTTNHTSEVFDGSENVINYRNDFLSYLGVASQVPNVICSALNLFVQFSGGNLTYRISAAILVEVIVFIITIILAIVDSSSWPREFFYTTMITVVIINIAGGIYQNSVYGLAGNFPSIYSNAVVLGTNISGTITSLIIIISIALSPNLKIAAIYYFLAALFILLICFDTYFGLPLNKFYKFYCSQDKTCSKGDEASKSKNESEQKTKTNKRIPPYLMVFKKTWPQCLNVFMVFFVTLSVFPAVHANIKPINKELFGSDESTKKYFTAITCFLTFNSFALVGNIIPRWIQKPGPDHLWIPIVMRFLLIPFFLFCNYQVGINEFGEELRIWTVYIRSDWVYILGGIILGVTSGYFSSLCMMYAPRCVPQEHSGTAGMMAAFFLICGIFSGVNFSFVLSWLVKQNWF